SRSTNAAPASTLRLVFASNHKGRRPTVNGKGGCACLRRGVRLHLLRHLVRRLSGTGGSRRRADPRAPVRRQTRAGGWPAGGAIAALLVPLHEYKSSPPCSARGCQATTCDCEAQAGTLHVSCRL